MSDIIEVTRADLAWALNAVLPHVGPEHARLDSVGFHVHPLGVELFASDRYTAGIASCVRMDDDGTFQDFGVPVKEAKDLLRFVRPARKRDEGQAVQLLYVPGTELHVGFPPSEDSPDGLSEVYEVTTPGVSYRTLSEFLASLETKTPTSPVGLPYNPAFLARWAKAARTDLDRLLLVPVNHRPNSAATYITVGTNFRGAIQGLTWEVPHNAQEEAA